MGQALNIRLNDGDQERLREIARKVGAIAPSGGPKGQPSISRLLMMIASGKLAVERVERGTMTQVIESAVGSKFPVTHKCVQCGYLWSGKPEPKRCANPECRSTHWNRQRPLDIQPKAWR